MREKIYTESNIQNLEEFIQGGILSSSIKCIDSKLTISIIRPDWSSPRIKRFLFVKFKEILGIHSIMEINHIVNYEFTDVYEPNNVGEGTIMNVKMEKSNNSIVLSTSGFLLTIHTGDDFKIKVTDLKPSSRILKRSISFG